MFGGVGVTFLLYIICTAVGSSIVLFWLDRFLVVGANSWVLWSKV